MDHGRIPFSLSYPRVPPISDSITANSILIVPKDLYRAQLYSSEACGSHNINQRLTANSILIVTTHGELNLYSRDLIITVDGGCGVGVANAFKERGGKCIRGNIAGSLGESRVLVRVLCFRKIVAGVSAFS